MVRSAVIEDATAASSQRLTLPLVGSIAHHATIGLSFTLVLLQAGALGGAHAVGLVVGLPMFMMVASSSFWGSMADRWRNRKRVRLLENGRAATNLGNGLATSNLGKRVKLQIPCSFRFEPHDPCFRLELATPS